MKNIIIIILLMAFIAFFPTKIGPNYTIKEVKKSVTLSEDWDEVINYPEISRLVKIDKVELIKRWGLGWFFVSTNDLPDNVDRFGALKELETLPHDGYFPKDSYTAVSKNANCFNYKANQPDEYYLDSCKEDLKDLDAIDGLKYYIEERYKKPTDIIRHKAGDTVEKIEKERVLCGIGLFNMFGFLYYDKSCYN